METILIIDDEEVLRDALSYNLEQAGYRVITVGDGPAALEIVRSQSPSLIILDILLPGMDGLEVCRRLRQLPLTADTPLLILTALGEEVDKVVGLEVGADDYLTKPFNLREFLARVRALLRRAARPSTSEAPAWSEDVSLPPGRLLEVGPIQIDPPGRRVFRQGQEIVLQPKQFDLLVYLVRHRGVVLTREVLLSHVWGYDYAGDTRTVDVHVRWLREKLEDDPANPTLIRTVRGVGYCFR